MSDELTTRRRTFVLADNPSKRHLCPVTLFLSLAVADGVVGNIHHSNLTPHADWTVIPYQANLVHLAVMRRTGSRTRLISSCAIKPAALEKMIHAQVDRAGHRETYAAIINDNHKASLRDKRSMIYSLF
jgi:hypothetical protein